MKYIFSEPVFTIIKLISYICYIQKIQILSKSTSGLSVQEQYDHSLTPLDITESLLNLTPRCESVFFFIVT